MRTQSALDPGERPHPVLPSPVAHKINREIVVVLGWGRAILLQFAHPLVAAGLVDHSSFQAGLRGYIARARRTIGAMLALTFGSAEQAQATASVINGIHNRINGTLRQSAGVFPAGTPYSARDPELLRWVHATMMDSVPMAYELLVGPLTRGEKDRYCAEAAAIAPLLGIPHGFLPATLEAHEKYMAQMFASGQIAVTNNARTLARGLLTPPLGIVGAPFFSFVRLPAIGLLPADIRQAFGFRWDQRDQDALARRLTFVSRMRQWLPQALREWPAARKTV